MSAPNTLLFLNVRRSFHDRLNVFGLLSAVAHKPFNSNMDLFIEIASALYKAYNVSCVLRPARTHSSMYQRLVHRLFPRRASLPSNH